MAISAQRPTSTTAVEPKGLLTEQERLQLKRRQRRGHVLEFVTLIPIVLAIILILFIIFTNINNVFVWQSIDRSNRSSEQLFDARDITSATNGYRTELEAQGLSENEIIIAIEPNNSIRRETLLAMGIPEFATDSSAKPILDDEGNAIEAATDNEGELIADPASQQIFSEAFIDGMDERRRFLESTRVDWLLEANGESNKVIVWNRRDNIEDQYPYLQGRANKAELAAKAEAEANDFVLNPLLDLQFFIRNSSARPQMAGFGSAIIGTAYLVVLVIVLSLIIGVSSAIYLEEYAPENRFTNFLEINLRNLAGVPSIVYGLLGLYTFVRALRMGNSVIAGALTLTLLILPVVIIASREAISAVPDSLRQASYGLGATKWQTVSSVILPNAITGIVTGIILAIARAIGETAPLIMVGGAGFITSVPGGWDFLLDGYTAMPLQIYAFITATQKEFTEVAAAGILVLLIILACIYLLAFFIRLRFERKW